MTCPHCVENDVRCILSQFFYDFTEQGLSYPGLPYIHSFLRVIKLSQHCGVTSQQDLCEGSTFDVSSLDITEESKEKYLSYKEKMIEKWSNTEPPTISPTESGL